MLWKCYSQYASKFGKLSSGCRTGKSQFSFHPKERQWQKCSNYHTIALISCTIKVMPQILQARLQKCMNWELPDVQLDWEKAEEPRNQIANVHWIIEKAREFQKNIYFNFIDCTKALTMWISKSVEKFERWEDQTTLPASWETCMLVKKLQLEPAMEWWTRSKLGKAYVMAVYCHPTYMQSISCEMPGWMKGKLESRVLGEISTTSDMQIIPPLWQRVKRN